ncbi:ectoine/hydroxyectoine ABC transporter substrate-binding protein EhuB [Mesorhizobium sp. M1005]|uniref:ectoine/hydroxyectoine ABC transporter substrate-binding protein EhuB n=1 Tax=unclassified Mesorhizobium TaxID=325217 RepID=UPI0033362AE6
MKITKINVVTFISLSIFWLAAPQVFAGELTDRIASGTSIRIGFANEAPFGFPGDNNQPLGFVNAFAIGVLHEMGYENVEPVVTDWGGLIPGLQAGRFDLVTGGLAILGTRCQSVAFSEPMMKVSDAFIVQPGNPKGLANYRDIASKGAMMVAASGYNTIEAAKKEGVPDSQIMQVPGPTEMLAAVEAGRADAGASTYLILRDMAKKSGAKVEVTDPNALPDWTQNWVGIAFRQSDNDFVEKFNAAQKRYLGTPAMMKAVAPFGYDEKVLPGDTTTAWACANR